MEKIYKLKLIHTESDKSVSRLNMLIFILSFYTNNKNSFSNFVFIYVLFVDLKYKEDAFIFMLF